MTKIKLDSKTARELARRQSSAQLCNQDGKLIGYFHPVPDVGAYENPEPRMSEAELRRREKESGRPLADILTDLRKKK